VGSVPSFWQKKYVGVPTWGWATIAGVAVLSGSFLVYRSMQKSKEAAPAAPAKAEKKEAPAKAEAPLVPVSSDV
jgi:hypothetical protein